MQNPATELHEKPGQTKPSDEATTVQGHALRGAGQVSSELLQLCLQMQRREDLLLCVLGPKRGEARLVQPAIVELIGYVASGDGEGAKFTTLEWVRNAFEVAFGFVPAPGTFNVQLTSADWAEVLRGAHGDFVSRLDPPPGFCVAHCYQVTVDGQVGGVLVMPDVDEYPLDKAEIVAPISIRRALDLRDGDAVRLSIALR